MHERVLIVEDETAMQAMLTYILSKQGYQVSGADSYHTAVQMMAESPCDVVVSDLMLGQKTGLDLLKTFQEYGYDAYTIVITGFPTLQSAQEALRYGAFDYLTKPVRKEALVRAVELALKHKAIRDEKERLRANLEAIFYSVDNAIITVDSQFNLLEVNEAASQLCHIQTTEVGQPLESPVQHCMGECVATLKQAFIAKRKVNQRRLVCHREDKPAQVVNITASPLLNRKSHFSGAVMVISDETKLANMEKALATRHQFHRLVGKSQAMQSIFSLIEDLADVETTVLITGASGTGKELVAEAIHNQGARKDQILVRVNCAALTETLLESELFGHVKGAFTGALTHKIGRFQLANKGTLFLDEIGDISPAMQVKLLRVLQEKQFERVGDTQTIKVDVRVIAATHQNLPECIVAGKFREDLYYRLKVVEIVIPPLCQRPEDIPALVDHCIHHFNHRFHKQIDAASEAVLQIFLNHVWPGNVRELQHAIEHAFVVCRDPIITPEHLPADLQNRPSYPPQTKAIISATASEEEKILQALRQTNWRRKEAAKILGMGRSTFFRKLKKYGISKKPA